MSSIIWLAVGLAIGIVLGKRRATKGAATGLAQATADARREKEAGKVRIMEMVKAQGSVTNDQVQALLDISDATATNYLQELENAGHIKQEGGTGAGVTYTLR